MQWLIFKAFIVPFQNRAALIKCKFPQKLLSLFKLVIKKRKLLCVHEKPSELKSAWPFDCLSINERCCRRQRLQLKHIKAIFFPWWWISAGFQKLVGLTKKVATKTAPPTKPLLIISARFCSNSFCKSSFRKIEFAICMYQRRGRPKCMEHKWKIVKSFPQVF